MHSRDATNDALSTLGPIGRRADTLDERVKIFHRKVKFLVLFFYLFTNTTRTEI
jgi:hypothetical protein